MKRTIGSILEEPDYFHNLSNENTKICVNEEIFYLL